MSVRDRLLILAPRGRDAQVIAKQLESLQPVAVIATAREIVEAVRAGELGAAVVTDEAMADFDVAGLTAALASQPPWSDSPFLVLTRREFGGWTRASLAALLGNVSILERPLRSDVLISGVRSALRARLRQRRAQAHIIAREAAETQVRALAATLERRVDERTAALREALIERADTESQLHDREAIYRHTIELTAQTPWTADADGRLLGVGPGWAHVAGADEWRERVHSDDADAVTAMWTAAVSGATPFLVEFRLRRDDGRYSWCRSRAAPRQAPDGTVMRWYGTLEDIDEQRVAANRLRQMQAELIHVSRLSAMGAMASTLAHELNQPLTAITNYIRGSRRMVGTHPDYRAIREALDHADRNAVRAGEIVRRVRDLVSKGDVQRRPEDLTTIVREAIGLALIDAHSSAIDIQLRLAVAPVQVAVDRIQIQQVLLNLLRNAAEAVQASPVRRITVTTRTDDDNFCEVVINDTGPGLSPPAEGRLFEPFNTTKSDGMGIGLSISRTIIEAHGGSIWHRAPAAGGAQFGFSLLKVLVAVPTAS